MWGSQSHTRIYTSYKGLQGPKGGYLLNADNDRYLRPRGRRGPAHQPAWQKKQNERSIKYLLWACKTILYPIKMVSNYHGKKLNTGDLQNTEWNEITPQIHIRKFEELTA